MELGGSQVGYSCFGKLYLEAHYSVLGKPNQPSPTCNQCNGVISVNFAELKHRMQLGEESLEKASAIELSGMTQLHSSVLKTNNSPFSDPKRALLLTTITYNLLLPTLPPSSHPLLALTRFRLPLLISELFLLPPPTSLEEQQQRDGHVDEVCRAAAQCVAGVRAVFPDGHPVRGIALAELGKLFRTDISSEPDNTPTATVLASVSPDTARFPRGADRLRLAFDTLLRARRELRIGFGAAGEHPGGDVGKQVDEMIQDIERELGAWRKARNAGVLDA